MPHIPPISRREIKKSGVLDEDRFFQLISERCNYVDKTTIKTYYMEMVKVVVAEIRTNGIARLPHLGDFALVKQNPKKVFMGKTRVMVDKMYTLKFYPKDALKQYFSKFSSARQDSGLDPREKILNKNI